MAGKRITNSELKNLIENLGDELNKKYDSLKGELNEMRSDLKMQKSTLTAEIYRVEAQGFQRSAGGHQSPYNRDLTPPSLGNSATDPDYGVFTDEDYGLS